MAGSLEARGAAPESERRWSLVTNHGKVLICVARAPDLRIRDIATLVGITEHATHGILKDLARAGFLERFRSGRRNHYRVRRDARLVHPLMEHVSVGDLLDSLSVPGLDEIGPQATLLH